MSRLKSRARRGVRRTLQHAGRRLGPRTIQRIEAAHSYLDLGQWASRWGDVPDHPTRFDLFDVARQHPGVAQAETPLYLEFGVWEGESLRWWAEHLPQPGARLVGFDSFEGLPEKWKHDYEAGHFTVDGVPNIDDERVSFEVGWFDDTLPEFKVPEHDHLIVNVDADLYSSAVLVLDAMDSYLVPGALLYFDELNDRDHELRALREWMARTGKDVRPLGMAKGGINWLFEVVD